MNRMVCIAQMGATPRLATGDVRSPRPGEVLVRMHAAALNFADLLMVQGRYQVMPDFPYVAGLEGAGVVEAAGPGVDIPAGARVAVWAQGTLADRAVFPASACTPVPDAMPLTIAAGFQIAYGTSHLALTGPGGLSRGETLAVLGAGGGVGLTAVEVGAARGARVIGIARGADKLQAVLQAGATEALDSEKTDDLKAALKRLGGVDVVFDAVGDAPGLAAFGALKPGGRHLLIGFAGGKPPALPLNHALVKNISILGFYWGGYRTLDPDALRGSLAALFGMYAQGLLHPSLGAVMPVERIADGYTMLRERRAVGKIVLTLTDENAAGA